jgi:hypothetical protein
LLFYLPTQLGQLTLEVVDAELGVFGGCGLVEVEVRETRVLWPDEVRNHQHQLVVKYAMRTDEVGEMVSLKLECSHNLRKQL